MKDVRLYDRETIHLLDWDAKRDGAYAKAFLLPLMRDGVKPYIANISTQLLALEIDDLVLPITVNDEEYENAYVCSPYTHYITYAQEELYHLGKPWLEKCLAGFLSLLSGWFKKGRINRVVCVNNWLVSTNLYHTLTQAQVERITQFLVETFPGHAILFRSVQAGTGSGLLDLFTHSAKGYKRIISRQIYIYEPKNDHQLPSKHRWILKRDQKLLAESEYRVRRGADIPNQEAERIVELYNKLYLDKYSFRNPQFTPAFIRLALRESLLEIAVLERSSSAEKGQSEANGSRIDAVLGYFVRNGVMTTPLFGYETDLPPETALYRLLSAQLVADSRRSDLILHQSSGAASFKRCRGAMPFVEYNVVYDRHLPVGRRIIWTVLQVISERIGIPMMQKLKL